MSVQNLINPIDYTMIIYSLLFMMFSVWFLSIYYIYSPNSSPGLIIEFVTDIGFSFYGEKA